MTAAIIYMDRGISKFVAKVLLMYKLESWITP
jgi:hypothetical protein